MWGTAAFFSFCLSTVFMIFYSISAVQIWPHPWNRISILTACFIPMLMVLVWKIPEWIYSKEFKKELVFILVIFILGILNIVFSENRAISLKVMTLFLVTGIGIFGVANCVMCTKFRQKFFLWLCWACLLALCVYGILEYINNKTINLLSFNPIPAGSLLILLIVGPLLLFPASSKWLCLLQLLSVVFGIAVIVMIGKRGPILGLLGMVFLFPAMLPRRKAVWAIPLIAVILIGTGYKMQNYLPSSLTRSLIGDISLLYRMENYPFTGYVIQKRPVFGIGLHSPLNNYLKNYKPKIVRDESYLRYIKGKKTFENIILCGFVEMGSLFSLTYIALIIFLLRRIFLYVKKNPKEKMRAILFLTPLFGFFVHSMTFDSLIYPHLNWLFHSYLGMMANFEVYSS